jgi:serine/threonine-protein kinase
MGEVYRAVHLELGRAFALKLMHPKLSADAGFVERFRREAMTASRLGHPNIVDIVDSGRAESGQFYFVMELLDGRTLTAIIAGGPTPLPLALELTTQIARALEVAHRAGVVHRDLKPDNVIVLERPTGPVAKLVDFGIAKVVMPSPDMKQTTHGVIMGTPQYMAPEQAAGIALDARADLYALGLILYELLTGQPPLTGETAALVMSAHISRPAPELPSRFPAPLRQLVAQMLAKRPGDRPTSMTEVLARLASLPRETAAPRRGLGIALALAGLGLGGVAWWVGRAPAPVATVEFDAGLAAAIDAGPPAPAPVVAPVELDAGPPAPAVVESPVRPSVEAGVKSVPPKPKKRPLKPFPTE